jgi:squalene-hopene/tetraprenyl-beta-curcumene cyclase
MLDFDRLRAAYEQAKGELLAERTPDGHWVGELSSSALSTATAVSALAVVRENVECRTSNVERREDAAAATFDLRPSTFDDLIARGVAYLAGQQNDDGGFGDTDLSHSNIATTYLVVAALHLAGATDEHRELLARADTYLESKGRLAGLRERYGIDKTFVVPIMTNLAIAGLLDWREIDQLPFELATVPQSLYRFVGMPVVSYAIPALVAIGQAQFHHAPPWNPLKRLVRWLSITRSLKVLRRMQPDSGGYLEATPLTSFVVMSLASVAKPRPVVAVNGEQTSTSRAAETPEPALLSKPVTPSVAEPPVRGGIADSATTGRGYEDAADQVIRAGIRFLVDSIRPDGSWPIDTNLATWNTTLAINALAGAGEDVAELLASKPRPLVAENGRETPAYREEGASSFAEPSVAGSPARESDVDSATTGRGFGVLEWLLSCQHTKRHPFTGADPGGFGWTDLSGAVPDADDTPGAIIALFKLESGWSECHGGGWHAWGHARNWLLELQNRDGGWPTFCRGWGRLPFDRSGTDLTAHALRAFRELGGPREKPWNDVADGYFEQLYRKTIDRGLLFLATRQHPDGSWSPLWFGNQDNPEEDNPVYGTAKVLMAYRDLGLMDSPEAQRGVAWLVANQNEDGGWGSGVWGKAGARARGWGLGEERWLASIAVRLSPRPSPSVVSRISRNLPSPAPSPSPFAILRRRNRPRRARACPESAASNFRSPTSDLRLPPPAPSPQP